LYISSLAPSWNRGIRKRKAGSKRASKQPAEPHNPDPRIPILIPIPRNHAIYRHKERKKKEEKNKKIKDDIELALEMNRTHKNNSKNIKTTNKGYANWISWPCSPAPTLQKKCFIIVINSPTPLPLRAIQKGPPSETL
jgi:hypothetical protein